MMLLAAAATFALGSGQAQPSARPVETRAETDRAVRTMHSFSLCVARRSPRGVARLLRLEPGTRRERSLMVRLANPDCLRPTRDEPDALSFQEHLFRGGLYEALYRTAFQSRLDLQKSPTFPWRRTGLSCLPERRPQRRPVEGSRT